jgi:hypothetical protein
MQFPSRLVRDGYSGSTPLFPDEIFLPACPVAGSKVDPASYSVLLVLRSWSFWMWSRRMASLTAGTWRNFQHKQKRASTARGSFWIVLSFGHQDFA